MTEQTKDQVHHVKALVHALRHPTKAMLDAMGSAMSPGKRPTDKFVTSRQKHRIRFLAAIEVLLGAEQPVSSEPVINALRDCHSVMEYYSDMIPDLEFHDEWRLAMRGAAEALARGDAP